MTTFFISRHPGARDWAEAEGHAIDRVLDHLTLAEVRAGDRVMGTLPIHLAAAVCERGARYFHLSLDLPPSLRGRELDADTLRRYGARLEEFTVRRVPAGHETLGSAA